MGVQTSAYTQTLTAALLTIAKGWTQLKWPLADEWANQTGTSME